MSTLSDSTTALDGSKPDPASGAAPPELAAPDSLATDSELEAAPSDQPEAPVASEASEAPIVGAASAETLENQVLEHPPTLGSAEAIREQVIENCKAIYDPEIPVNIWELGLIYAVDVTDEKVVHVDMTLTSPMCPTAQSLVGAVEMAARDVPFVTDAIVDLVWEPPWGLENMSEEARLMFGF